MVDYLPIY